MIRNTAPEVASEPAWFKSSYSSGSEGDSCVEIATVPGTVHVRDSKDVQGPQLALSATAWGDFLTYAQTAK
ncbi:DUF397 domain-containing protein [Streptomyces sp. RY43-2]|uniref:DUF397 domain-containing protein n=1 Tax=Streptomyces macrolidinus TaxID=2952607 RepID=A0ABT0ZHD9_9ACTN|nr:DUF397 domain-containing protein [Streptomyces macrolidinus]MCN9242994.1 DUF397 domain-containing protein [Streptomyces macrolidinus]